MRVLTTETTLAVCRPADSGATPIIATTGQAMSRRRLLAGLPVAGAVFLAFGGSRALAAEGSAAGDRFDFLSANGNSNCSTAFMESIATMPADARLQGSCCSPMDRQRYLKQVEGLTKYKAVAEIPSDPYDIVAGLAQKLMAQYDATLTPAQQPIYQFAMDNSAEQGPCCCQCWRWQVYGGLAKLLIHEHQFTGKQIVEVWNLSDGCGGA